MRGHTANEFFRNGIMPAKRSIVAGGNERISLRQQNAPGGITGVPFLERRDGFGGGKHRVKFSIHAGRVKTGAIRRAGQPEDSGRQVNGFRLLELHARMSSIASARSSTRWKVGKPGNSYSA